MVVGDDELDAGKAASAQAKEEVLPGGAALAFGLLDGEDLTPAVPVDADGDQHGLGADDAVLADLLVAGVQDEVGVGLGERAPGEGGEAVVQPLVDGRDGRGREGVAAQLLGDGLDLPGRDALNVHLGERRHERLLGALIAFEQLGREAAVAVLRHPQLELADRRDERARVVAGAVSKAGRRALALLGPERIRHLGFEHLLHHGTHDLAQAVRLCQDQVFDDGESGSRLECGCLVEH